jgi:predicted nuclease of predicted toxin-antitoxin system
VSPRFLADENIDPDLVLGLRRRVEGIDILRVQDVGLRTVDDAEILQWAADEGRILISHDLKTIPGFAGRATRRRDAHARCHLASCNPLDRTGD